MVQDVGRSEVGEGGNPKAAVRPAVGGQDAAEFSGLLVHGGIILMPQVQGQPCRGEHRAQ